MTVKGVGEKTTGFFEPPKNSKNFLGGEKIRKQILLILITIFLAIILSGTVSAADGDVIYVNSSSGLDTNDGFTPGAAKLSIKNATGSVNTNGEVKIADGTYSGDDNINIIINKNMKITGQSQAGTIIDAQGQDKIFIINPGITVTLENITLKNGKADNGGAIFNGGNCTITHCTLQNNTANDRGGAIYNDGFFESSSGSVNCIITESNFINNTANDYGGAIYNYGYFYYGYSGSVNCIITKSNFNNNTAKGYGGAIFNYCFAVGGSGSANCTITESNFTNNTAGAEGGAIHSYGRVDSGSGSANCIITESNFTNNKSRYSGGAIYSRSSYLYGSGSTICTANYNRFYNNQGSSGDDIGIGSYGIVSGNIENNWWGSNNPNWTDLIDGFTQPTNWVILSVNATPNNINNTQSSIITADFNHINGGGDLIGGHIPDGPIKLDIPWGSFTNPVISHSYIANTVAGVITATFYAIEGATPINPVRVNATADGYTTNDTESAYIYINPVANLNITKIGPTTAIAGTTITYTITIINKGLDPAEGVSLSDAMTSNIFDTGSTLYRYKTNDNDWSSWISFNNPLILNLGTIINDKNATIEIKGTINASTTSGSIINNTATTNTTTTPGNKTAGIQTIVTTQSDLNVTKVGPESAYAGTQITYTITVENNGPSDAQNVVIVDSIPAILQNVSHDSFNLGTIPAGESKTIYINGTIPSNIPIGTTFQNNATVTSDTIGIIVPSLMIITTVDTLADVYLNKTVNNTRPNVGDIVKFIVTAHNYGPSDATNIQIRDIMPSEFTNVSIIPSKGTYDNGTGIWTLNLVSGEEATLNLTGIVTVIMAGKNTTNNATIISQTQTDPDTLDTANAIIYVPKANLYIQITSNNNKPSVGEIFTIRYKLGNYGPDDALNVTINIPLPDGFVISKIEGDGTWTINGNTITWTLKNVTVGDPYLYVSGLLNHAGIFIFSSSINSDTYNINTQGVTPVTINAVSKVKAASKTIGMRETGLPVNYLILAILMVISGFLLPKRK